MLSMEYIQENKNYYEEKINELNDKVKYYQNKTQRQGKEIERLKNIINELEKSLKNEVKKNIEYDRKNNSEWQQYNAYCTILDKLKELRDDDNE
jgi:phage gpG-like protein